MRAAEKASALIGVVAACAALGVSKATLYRRRRQPAADPKEPKPRAPSHRALPEAERQEVLDVLRGERFVDMAPAAIHATLLDEGVVLCSVRTMYRILAEHGEVRERRDQLRHPARPVPRLKATRPNQVWTWDITKLRGPGKGVFYQLYVVLDLYSRCVVAWRLEAREDAELAKEMIAEACWRHGIGRDQLVVHADRGPAMTSASVTKLLSDLGVGRSHSRPRVSNDNPFSESQFKTLKYRPEFPGRFGSLADARLHCRRFFNWYHHEHRHSGIAWLTPSSVHLDQAEEILAKRHEAMLKSYAKNPERYVNGPPKLNALPAAVWINEPQGLELPRGGDAAVENSADQAQSPRGDACSSGPAAVGNSVGRQPEAVAEALR